MQSVKKSAHSPLLWGIATLIIVLVISVGLASVYISPPTQKIVTFYTDDASSINSGDTVRIAGLVVGKVKNLSIEPNQVRVRANVDNSAFVGDQSQIEVRMLTVVGGYYVTIVSLGDTPLGSRPIPKERVTMPYSLVRTLADATKISENIKTRPINESINQLQQGLTGSNTDALTQLIHAGNAVTDTLERQRGQLSEILDMSNEYLRTLNGDHELVKYLISRLAILEETLTLYGKGFGAAIEGIGEIGSRLAPLSEFWMFHRNDLIARIHGVLGEFQTIANRNGLVVRVLRRIRERMEGTLAAQDEFATRPGFGGTAPAPELFATDLCIPVEGSRC